MNKFETTQLLSMFSAVWSNEEITPQKVEVYHAVLGDKTADELRAAAIAYMRTGRFFPRPADLLDLVSEMSDQQLPAGDAWEVVQKMVRRHGRDYWADAERDFAAYPAILEAVKQVGWRRICDEDRSKGDFVRRDFDAAYAQASERDRKAAQIGQIAAPALKAVG